MSRLSLVLSGIQCREHARDSRVRLEVRPILEQQATPDRSRIRIGLGIDTADHVARNRAGIAFPASCQCDRLGRVEQSQHRRQRIAGNERRATGEADLAAGAVGLDVDDAGRIERRCSRCSGPGGGCSSEASLDEQTING